MPKSGRKAKSKAGGAEFQVQGHRATATDRLVDLLDDFAEWRENFAPILREDLRKGLNEEKLREKYASYAQARAIAIAMGEPDSGKALAAIKDILDRKGGKAKESVAISHRLEKIDESELDALILSKASSVKALPADEE